MRAAALEPVLAVRVVAVCSASIRVLLYLEMLLNEANLLKRHTPLKSTFLSQPSPVRAAALPRRLPPLRTPAGSGSGSGICAAASRKTECTWDSHPQGHALCTRRKRGRSTPWAGPPPWTVEIRHQLKQQQQTRRASCNTAAKMGVCRPNPSTPAQLL